MSHPRSQEERSRANGAPTLLPNETDAAFPLTRPDWDYNTPAGREQLRLYRQVLLAGLKGAGRHPTNLAQVRAVTQGPEETPEAFLERLMEAYCMYTPFMRLLQRKGPLGKRLPKEASRPAEDQH